MNLLNKFRKFNAITTAIGFIVIGLIMAGISGWTIVKDSKSDVVYQETPATIVSIKEEVSHSGSDTQYEYHVFVDYTVSGKTYKNVEYGSYSSSMKEGDTVTLLYNPADPEDIRTPGSEKIPYILLAVGGAAVILGVYFLIKCSKTRASDMNEYDRVDVSRVDPAVIEEIENSTESMRKYVFHYAGKLNQGYVMKNEMGEAVYEAVLEKFSAVKPSDYTFVNYITGKSVPRKLGHTVTTTAGAVSGFSFSVPIDKHFTVDGQNNWDFLAENGYSFDFAREGIAICFKVKHYGVQVAYLKTAGTNAMTGKNYAIGNMPVNGIYEVECRNSDLDMIFMVCVSISRAIFYEK